MATPAVEIPNNLTGAEPDPLIGRIINDRYRIVEQIGHGGMGRVYKALQAPLDRLVALKVLGAGHDRDPNFYKRFFLEASVTAKLTHPNTITLYDYGRTDDGIFFIAMEYLNGRTLSLAMQQEGALAQERVIHIAQQICRSLREAHALGIIHRDMKPANVMLLRQHDDHDFVKVLDFGLVKFFSGESHPESDITNAGTFMGSPHYIAPEQARNQSPDQRCDIYSLGILLYHMLTGRVPFTAQAPVDIILKHLHEAPVPPREVRPDLNIAPELQDIVLKCMAKAREDRFQSMDELLAQLKRVRASVTGVNGPASLPPISYNDTSPGMAPLSPALVAATPPGPLSMRTPSQPMPSMQTPAAGSPHVSRPPPPPLEALLEDELPIPTTQANPKVAPASKPFNKALFLIPAAAVIAAGALVFVKMNAATVTVKQLPPSPTIAAATPVATQPIAPAAAEPAPYPAANAGTTLVSLTSTPPGAEIRDTDDRLLGLTPFDLRVPSAHPLQLTLRHEGFRPVKLNKKVDGEHVAVSVSMKKDKGDTELNKRSVGYKDDPY
jgi:serine/threonine protein kinase